MGRRNVRKRRAAVAGPTASGFDATVRLPMQTHCAVAVAPALLARSSRTARGARVKRRLEVAKKLVRIHRYGLHFLASQTSFSLAQNP